MVFIAAGMGGGTGTGAAPIVAEVAKSLGALTVAVVSKPFSHEGQKCMDIADEGLEQLSANVDSLIVILNEKLEEIYEDESLIEWLQHADDVLNNAVAGIAEIINVPGHINVDFNDVKTIMGEQGKAMMGTATASGVDRARIAAEQAVASPLLDGVDLSGARGVLVNVTASRGLKGKEIKEVMAAVRAFAAPDARSHRVSLTTTHGRRHPRDRGCYRPGQSQETRAAGATADAAHRHPQRSDGAIGCHGRRGRHHRFDGVGSSIDGGANAAMRGMKAPAVWRRESAAEQVAALEKNGMEQYDIPAFCASKLTKIYPRPARTAGFRHTARSMPV
jgi:cell division protein FtsZ